MKKFDSSLYFITDSNGFDEAEFLKRCEDALKGGATLIQLREKDKTTREYIDIARKLHEITKKLQCASYYRRQARRGNGCRSGGSTPRTERYAD